MIIIEGADATGKSTLAKQFADAGYTHVHSGPPSKDPFIEYFEKARNAPAQVVFDRFHIGERVYGPIFRNNDRLNSARQRMLERYLLSQRAVLVHAHLSVMDGERNFVKMKASRDEMIANVTQYHDVRELFWRVVHGDILGATHHGTHLPVVEYNFLKHPFDYVCDAIRRVMPPPNGGPGIGMFKPGVTLLVGDQVNVNANEQFNVPFVGLGGCSEWLAEKLDEARISEKSLYWINAHEQTGEVTDARFVDQLQPKRIIALGNNAYNWCEFHGFNSECVKVPHPSFWRRFRTNQPYALTELL